MKSVTNFQNLSYVIITIAFIVMILLIYYMYPWTNGCEREI